MLINLYLDNYLILLLKENKFINIFITMNQIIKSKFSLVFLL